MSTALAVTSTQGSLAPANLDQAMRLAELMSNGKLVPTHLQRQPSDCLMVIEQAMRWNMSPFAVAQSTSVIQGKLMFEGKLVAAVINANGGLDERLRYEYSGEGDKRTIKVIGRLKGEKAPRDVEVMLKDARTNNKVWQTQPDQQLMYHGARVWARRHMPELMLGVYSPEEFAEGQDAAPMRDVTPVPEPEPQVIEPAPRPFAVIDSEGVEHTFERGGDYLKALKEMFEAAPDKVGFWDSNKDHFQSWQTGLVQLAEKNPKKKAAADEFCRVGREIADVVYDLTKDDAA